MSNVAKLEYNGQVFELPIITGTENESAVDIRKLRDTTGLVTFDDGYKNTGSTKSKITFIDGDKGILHYRGYGIEELAEKAEFMEVAYLLIYGKLPNEAEYTEWKKQMTRHSLVHEDVKKVFDAYPTGAHPMGQLMTMVGMMSSFYPNSQDPQKMEEDRNLTIIRVMSKMPNLCAMILNKRIGHTLIYPNISFIYL
ncbi:MAG: citrate/2-methylcitrate synthase [Chitinophagales bacterium]